MNNSKAKVNKVQQLKHEYSPYESTVFETMRSQGPVTSDYLVDKIYGRGRKPHNARIIINSTIRALQVKLDERKEPYRVKREKRPDSRLIENSVVKR